ncbi:lysozyme-like protein [Linderina pennispora]|uniref:Lysozyme-like protein n=1 Tax=Linderina pennispora TaxID=61395 RepID=A0A1Y1VUX2_9FUNG|nr:lysozyme-like protein [Linderina pennispora]ORX65082.1 lysozyme-like protein [Linderina pennispora]
MKITAFTLGFLAAAASAAPAANAASGNSACTKTLALKITNIYENGDTNFHYDYCENIKDGRGFTSGISGFCTGTADAWEVVQQYHKLTGGKDSFSKYDGVLKKYAQSGSDSTSGLDGYCSVWSKLGKSDAKFRKAQDSIRDSMYYNPSQKLADQLGLKLSISRAQLYDCGIQHGTGSDADGLAGLIKTTNASFKADAKGSSGSTLKINGHNVDEVAWLTKFLQVRTNDLLHPKEKENASGAWKETLYRVKSYQYALSKKQYNWTKSVQVLDNDGKPVTVSC